MLCKEVQAQRAPRASIHQCGGGSQWDSQELLWGDGVVWGAGWALPAAGHRLPLSLSSKGPGQRNRHGRLGPKVPEEARRALEAPVGL